MRLLVINSTITQPVQKYICVTQLEFPVSFHRLLPGTLCFILKLDRGQIQIFLFLEKKNKLVQHNELEMSHGGGRAGILFIIGCVVWDFNTNWCLKSL